LHIVTCSLVQYFFCFLSMLEKTHWYGNNLNQDYYSPKIWIGPTLRETNSVYSTPNNLTYLGSIDQFISQTFSNRLDVSESRFPSSSTKQPDSLVHTSQRRYINSLSSNSTCTPNTGGVLTRATVNDCIYKDLERVLSRINTVKD
jgi:hypothetical protein